MKTMTPSSDNTNMLVTVKTKLPIQTIQADSVEATSVCHCYTTWITLTSFSMSILTSGQANDACCFRPAANAVALGDSRTRTRALMTTSATVGFLTPWSIVTQYSTSNYSTTAAQPCFKHCGVNHPVHSFRSLPSIPFHSRELTIKRN